MSVAPEPYSARLSAPRSSKWAMTVPWRATTPLSTADGAVIAPSTGMAFSASLHFPVDATKTALVEKYQREDPTNFALYGGYKSRGEVKSKHVVGAIKLLFNEFFPVRVLIVDGVLKEHALEYLRMVMTDIERHGVHQAPLDFSEPSETWRDAPPRCALCSTVDADGGARWDGGRYLCRECQEKKRPDNRMEETPG